MRALVTGASGFVGSHVARAAARAGHELRLLARPTSDLGLVSDLDAEVVRGDLRDPAAVARAVRGCEVVFHVAASYSLRFADRAEILATNVGGTRALLLAAAAEGVQRVVHTSSVAAVGLRADGRPSTEEDEADPAHLVGAYKRSKWLSEREALRIAAETGLEVVVVNPSTPVGWGDARPTPTGAILLDFLNRRMPAYVDTGLNFIDVEDVAAGHLLALERGRPRRRYILGARNMTLAELFAELEAVSGLAAPKRRLPAWVAVGAALADEFVVSPVLRRRPVAPLAGALMARRPMYFDASRAVAELGLPQHPIRDALAKAVRWFVETGRASAPGKERSDARADRDAHPGARETHPRDRPRAGR